MQTDLAGNPAGRVRVAKAAIDAVAAQYPTSGSITTLNGQFASLKTGGTTYYGAGDATATVRVFLRVCVYVAAVCSCVCMWSWCVRVSACV